MSNFNAKASEGVELAKTNKKAFWTYSSETWDSTAEDCPTDDSYADNTWSYEYYWNDNNEDGLGTCEFVVGQNWYAAGKGLIHTKLTPVAKENIPKSVSAKGWYDCYESSWETYAEWCPTSDYFFEDWWSYWYDYVETDAAWGWGTCTYWSCYDDGLYGSMKKVAKLPPAKLSPAPAPKNMPVKSEW